MMKPAVIMMYRDEEDILYQTLKHWHNLGIRNFYLIDNNSTDKSRQEAELFAFQFHKVNVKFYQNPHDNYIAKAWYNAVKNTALADGCDWIFPIDADEQLSLPEEFDQIQDWLACLRSDYHFCAYLIPYLDIFPTGEKIHEPQQKTFGRFAADWVLTHGNHFVENTKMVAGDIGGAYYKHYPIRSYEQFYRKTTQYMRAMANNPEFAGHAHARNFKTWQEQGDTFVQKLYEECLHTLIWPPV